MISNKNIWCLLLKIVILILNSGFLDNKVNAFPSHPYKHFQVNENNDDDNRQDLIFTDFDIDGDDDEIMPALKIDDEDIDVDDSLGVGGRGGLRVSHLRRNPWMPLKESPFPSRHWTQERDRRESVLNRRYYGM